MAYDPGAIDSALAAAVGDDPALIADLRLAFAESTQRAMRAVEDAGSDPDAWRTALSRLRGLSASFGAVRLAAACADALAAPAGDAKTLRLLRRSVARL